MYHLLSSLLSLEICAYLFTKINIKIITGMNTVKLCTSVLIDLTLHTVRHVVYHLYCTEVIKMLPYAYYLYCTTCTVLLILYYLYCTTYTVLLVLYHLYYTTCTVLLVPYYLYCTTHTVLLVLYYSYCTTYCTTCTVLLVLYYSYCTTCTVLYYSYCTIYTVLLTLYYLYCTTCTVLQLIVWSNQLLSWYVLYYISILYNQNERPNNWSQTKTPKKVF